MYIELSYAAYLVISIVMTVWVAHTLHSRGRIFLVETFHGNTELAESVNHLLVVGFYLISFGFVALALSSDAILLSLRHAIEFLSTKVGLVLLVLGLMHFMNLLVFMRIRSQTALGR